MGPDRDLTPITHNRFYASNAPAPYVPRETFEMPNQGEDPSLSDYLRILKKRLGLIAGTALAFFTAAALYCLFSSSLYTARSIIEMKGYAPALSGIQSEMLFGSDTRRIEYTKTTVAKLKLEGLADEILSKDDVSATLKEYSASREGFISRAMNWVTSFLDDDDKAPSAFIDQHFVHSPREIRRYLGFIDITPVHETNLVVISATTANPELSQRLANAHATGFIDHLQRERQESLESNLQLLRRQASELKDRVTTAEGELADYAEKNKLLTLSDNQANSMAVRQIEGLAGMLADTIGRRVKSESLLNEITSKRTEENSVLDDEATRQLRLTLRQAETEYATMGQRMTPAHPAMLELRAKIDSLRKTLQDERKRVIKGLQSQFETDKAAEEKLRSQIDQEKGNAQEISKRLIQYNVLMKEANSLRDLYQNVLRQAKEIEVSSASATSNVFVSDFASVPTEPSAPKVGLIMVMFSVLGLGVGLILSFILESFDRTLKSSEEIRSSLELPILGAVPEFATAPSPGFIEREKNRLLGWRRDTSRIAPDETNIIPVDQGGEVSRRIITVQAPGDAFSEALRTIRAGILLSSADNPPRVVMFTSAAKGEGKTTIVSNLAAILAQASHRTLVIDCDLRMRQLSRIFNEDEAAHSRGLSELLTGQAALDQVIHHSTIPNLDVLPAGSKAPNPAELLGSHAMEQLIQDLSRRYDYILVDSPPVLPVADPLMLSRLVDSVVLVVRSGQTDRKRAQEARRRLLRVNARVLGVVLNDVSAKSSEEYDASVYDGYIETRRSSNS